MKIKTHPSAPHGSLVRRSTGCGCHTCTVKRRNAARIKLAVLPPPDEIRWAFSHLSRHMGGTRLLSSLYSPELVAEWRTFGMSDEVAEKVSLRVGTMPHAVWNGWFEVGMDELREEDM